MIQNGIYTIDIHKTKNYYCYRECVPYIAYYSIKGGYFWQRTVVSTEREVLMVPNVVFGTSAEEVFKEEAASLKIKITQALSVNQQARKVNPETELLKNMIRFLCQYQDKLNSLRSRAVEVYPVLDLEKIREMIVMEWPLIQGTRNKMALERIGSQPFDKASIGDAVDIMLEK
jgi:hypothetical protein